MPCSRVTGGLSALVLPAWSTKRTVLASISLLKPTAGWKANAYVIFDYQSPTSFKFAGIDISVNKLVMGHRDATGWRVLAQVPFLAKADTVYNVLLSVNGLAATVVVDNAASLTYTFAPTVIDGYSYGLNYGFVGFGSLALLVVCSLVGLLAARSSGSRGDPQD